MASLFMILLGATPSSRNIEQHDIFFGIGERLHDLVPDVREAWPDAGNSLHIDGWRTISTIENYRISVSPKSRTSENQLRLFFINLGGYKRNEFEEFHYKMVIVAGDKGEAIRKAKTSAFFMHTGFEKANAHVDDKYGIDVDDIFEIKDILPLSLKEQYNIIIEEAKENPVEDELHLGYFKLSSFSQI